MYEARIRVSKTLGLPLLAASPDAAAAEAKAAAAHVAALGDEVEVLEVVDVASGAEIHRSAHLPPPGMVDVTWSVRISADNAIAGACAARLMQFNPASLAAVYRVRDAAGRVDVVDLQSAGAAAH